MLNEYMHAPMLSNTACAWPPNWLDRGGRWLLRSGIQEPGGGVARYFRADLGTHQPISTEITAYIASTFVYLHALSGCPEYLARAVDAARFLTRTAWNESLCTFPFEYDQGSSVEPLAYFFDCGIIIRGLLSVWRATGDAEFFTVARDCARAAIDDFPDGQGGVHAVLRLPEKRPLICDGRWSRMPGCYQLKAAVAWLQMYEATGEEQFRHFYRRVLDSAIRTQVWFLEEPSDRYSLVDRLHAYCYFLEGLLLGVGEGDAAGIVNGGMLRIDHSLRQAGAAFERSDVYAQLLRIRLLAASFGIAPLDRPRVDAEVKKLAQFQIEDADERVNGGFYFGRKDRRMLPHVNPVSTAFAIQAFAMLQQHDEDPLKTRGHALI